MFTTLHLLHHSPSGLRIRKLCANIAMTQPPNLPSLSMMLAMLGVLLTLNVVRAEVDECLVDQNCPSSSYCTTSRKCVPCIDCRIYMREPSKGLRNCAKKRIDCGPCLPGYLSDELTDQKYSIHCKPAPRFQRNIPREPVRRSENMYVLWSLLGCVLFVVFAALLGVYLWKIKKAVDQRIERPQAEERSLLGRAPSPNAPPPYQFRIPMRVGSESTFVTEVVGQKETVQNEHCRFAELIDNDQDTRRNGDAIPEETEDINGSSETIPSVWVPDLDVEDAPGSHSLGNAPRSRSVSPVSLAPPNPFYWSPITQSLPNISANTSVVDSPSITRWSSSPAVFHAEQFPTFTPAASGETSSTELNSPRYAFLAIIGARDLLQTGLDYSTSIDSGLGASEAGRRRNASSSSHEDPEDTVEVVLEVGARIVVRRSRRVVILDSQYDP